MDHVCASTQYFSSLLSELQRIQQQKYESMKAFGPRLATLLRRIDPQLSEPMRLYFLLTKAQSSIVHEIRKQPINDFSSAIEYGIRIEEMPGFGVGHVSAIVPLPPSTTSAATQPSALTGSSNDPMDVDPQQSAQRFKRGGKDSYRNHKTRGKGKVKRCFRCDEIGHFAKHCKTNQQGAQVVADAFETSLFDSLTTPYASQNTQNTYNAQMGTRREFVVKAEVIGSNMVVMVKLNCSHSTIPFLLSSFFYSLAVPLLSLFKSIPPFVFCPCFFVHFHY